MKARSTFLMVVYVAASPLFAEDLKPYDRLSTSNLTLTSAVGASGSKLDNQSLKTSYGTYVKDLSTEKEIIIKIPLLKKEDDITIEAYAVFKDHDSKKTRCSKVTVEKISDSDFHFTMSAEHTRERWMYAENGRVSQSGEKILGWFVRAISAGRIAGILASSPQYEVLAADPKEFGKMTAKN